MIKPTAVEYMHVDAVAAIFGVQDETIRSWCRPGNNQKFFSAIRPGRRYLIPRYEVDALIDESYGPKEGLNNGWTQSQARQARSADADTR